MNLPNPAWIAWNPDFGKCNKIDFVRGSLFYELTSLIHSSLKIEPDGLSLGGSNADSGARHDGRWFGEEQRVWYRGALLKAEEGAYICGETGADTSWSSICVTACLDI